MIAVAAFAVWIGGAILFLADGRRGQATGLAILGLGIAACVLLSGQALAGGALLVGGAAASALRYRSGPPGWGLMQPGSTPRVIVTVVVGIVALYVAVSLAGGDGAAIRFAWLAAMGLGAARVLDCDEPASALTAAAALALAIGAAAAIPPAPSGFAAAIIAAALAAGISLLPQPQPRIDGA